MEQAGEELKELLKELDRSMQINGSLVLPENTWSEIADVLIMCSQLTMQHGKEEQVRQQLEYKLNRQLQRIEEEQDQDVYKRQVHNSRSIFLAHLMPAYFFVSIVILVINLSRRKLDKSCV